MKGNDMRIKKWLSIICTVLVVLLVLLWLNSYSFAILQAGLQPNEITYSEYLAEDDGSILQFVQSRNDTGEVGLALLRRNALGIWCVLDSSVASEEGMPAMAQLGWMLDITAKKFDLADATQFEEQWHFVFCGDNAVDNLFFLEEQIPSNVAVNIRQGGSLYWIHVVSYDTDTANTFQNEIKSILVKNGCIS